MGQAKLRKIEIERLKSPTSDITLFKSDELEISEILDINQKRYWMRVYKNSYTGNIKNLSDPQLYSEDVRFIKAIIDGVDVGFIRINNKSHHFTIKAKSLENRKNGINLNQYCERIMQLTYNFPYQLPSQP